MKNNIHFVILVVGTVIFVAAAFLLIHLPSIPAEFVATPEMDAHIYEVTREVMVSSMQNGYILAVSGKMLFTYMGFVSLVFGHFYLVRKNM